MVNIKKKKSAGKGLKKHKVAKMNAARNLPIAISVKAKAIKQAKIRNTEKGVIIRHTEYLAPVTAPSTAGVFTAFQYRLNAQNQATFPWLSRQAPSYEKFKIHKLKMEYTPLCPTTSAGVVLGYFDYDVRDAPPNNLTTSLNNLGAKPMNVYAPFSVSYDRAFEAYKYYNNSSETAALESIADALQKFPANFYLCIAGAAANLDLGLLRVSYEIELYVPQLQALSVATGGQSWYQYYCTTPASTSTGVKWTEVMKDSWRKDNPSTGGNQSIYNEQLDGIRIWREGDPDPGASVSGQIFTVTKPGSYMISFTQTRDGNSQAQTSQTFTVAGAIKNPSDIQCNVAITSSPSGPTAGTCNQTGIINLDVGDSALGIGGNLVFIFAANWLTMSLKKLYIQLTNYQDLMYWSGYTQLALPLYSVALGPSIMKDSKGKDMFVLTGTAPADCNPSNEVNHQGNSPQYQSHLETPSSGQTVSITPSPNSSCRSEVGGFSLPSWRS